MGKVNEKSEEIKQLEQDVKELAKRMEKVEGQVRDIQQYLKGFIVAQENGKQ